MGVRQLNTPMLSGFVKGAKIKYLGSVGTIVYADDKECLIKYEDSELSHHISIKNLLSEFGKTFHFVQNLRPVNQLAGKLTAKQKYEIDRRQMYVDKTRELTLGNAGVGGLAVRIQAIKIVKILRDDLNPPSPATVARWVQKANTLSYGAANDIIFSTRKPHKSQYEGFKLVFLTVLDDHYFSPSLPTIKSAYEIFKSKIKADESIPSYPTFIEWVKDVCWLKDSKARHGKRATRETMRNAVSKFITTKPLERVEVDGVRLALGLIDNEGNYLGTPTIIIAIDCYTRCILGYRINIGKGEPASAYVDTYRHAMFPKSKEMLSPNCKNDWPCYGIWESAVVDGGTGALSEASYAFLLSVGMTQNVVQVAAGWKKPFIERFNGTLRTNFAQHIKGYCGHDLNKIQDATVKQKAHLTPEVFQALLDEWIVDDYHQNPHTGLNGKNPVDKWQEALIDEAFIPFLPSEALVAQLPQGKIVWRKIPSKDCHQGVLINGVHYNDKAGTLKMIGMTLKRKGNEPTVECHYSEGDISAITVIDPETENPIRLEAVEPNIHPGMSLVEYQAKYPTAKNISRERIFAQSDSLKQANESFDEKMRHKKPPKQRNVNTEAMTQSVLDKKQEIQQAQSSAEQDNTGSQKNKPSQKNQPNKHKKGRNSKGFKYD